MNYSTQAHDELRKIAEGVSAATGEAFFRSLVENLAHSLDMDYAFVVRLAEDLPQQGRTIAGYGRGQLLDNIVYDLAGTPCHDVIRQKVCCYPADVQKQFPLDRYLAETGMESYAGIALVDAAGSVLGLIAAMHSRPMDRPDVVISALRIWAARATAELERLSSDAALRESEARFRNLFENSPDAIFVEDIAGRVLDVNRAACALHGARREELIGKNVMELVPPEHRRQAAEDLARLIRGDLDRIEGFSLTKTGRTVPVSIRVSRIDDGGQPALLLHVRDISDRVQVEQALRESQEILEKAQAVGQVGSWISDPDEQGRLEWSAETCRIFGISAERFDGQVESFFSLVHPDDRAAVQEASRAALAGGRPYAVEHRIVRPDGALRWVHQQADVQRDERGRPQRMVGVIRDITEQKLAQDALRDSEARLRALLVQMPAVMWTLDTQMRITLSLGRALAGMGLEPNQTVGMTLEEYLRGREDAEQVTQYHRLALRGESVQYEARVDGIALECRVESLRDAQGEIVGCLGVALDVTDQRRVVQALRESEERLRLLLEQLPAVLWVVNSEQEITLALGRPLAVMGRTPDNTVGLPLAEYFHGRIDAEQLLQYHLRALGGESVQYETEVCGIALECRLQPLRSSQGEIVGCLGVSLDVTDRVRALVAVRESENRFRTIFTSTPECVKLLSRDGTLLEINAAGLAMIEAESPTQVVGQCVYPIVVAEHRAKFQRLIEQVFRGQAGVLEFEIQGLKGTRRWLESHGSPLPDAAGRVVAALSVTRDVTGRKRAEQELQQRNHELEAIFQAYPDLYFVVNSSGTIEQYRAGRSSDLYVPPAAFLGMKMHAVLPPEVAAKFDQAFGQLAAGSPLETVEYELAMPAGAHQFEARVASLPDQRIAVLVRNITDRKLLEEAMRESEDRFRQFAEHLPYMVCMITPDMRKLLYINRAGETIFGRSRDLSLPLESWLEMVHEGDRQKMADRLGQPFDNNPWNTDFRIVRPDGTVRWVQSLAVPLRNERGEFYLLTVLVEDITERKMAAERLALQQAELLHVSRLSTMGHLVATMSHDISQPLAALRNFSAACSQLLESNPRADPEQFRGYVREMARQCTRASSIVKRLRSFGSKSVPDREPCDLNWLLRDSVDLVGSELRRLGIAVDWQLTEPLALALVDRIQLQQVMVNLLTNACDSMLDVEPARRAIVVRTFVLENDAAIEIVDNGIGLSPEIMPSLFQPFFTTKPDGMGLGLSICREIVEDHGGKIEAVPSDRSGATFRVRMPLEQDEAQGSGARSQESGVRNL